MPFEVAVVLGAGMQENGRPGRATVLRAKAAAKLARGNPELLLILSGDGRVDRNGQNETEAAAMARIIEKSGIARNRLLLEGDSRDTMGNAVLVSVRYLNNMRPGKLFLVTSPFHAQRALMAFQGVLGDNWQVETFLAKPAVGDERRQTRESGGIQWTQDFFNGVEKGNLKACIDRLVELRPFYGEMPCLSSNEYCHNPKECASKCA